MTASTQHVKEKYWRDHIRQAEQSGGKRLPNPTLIRSPE